MQRFATVEEVANMIVYVSSPLRIGDQRGSAPRRRRRGPRDRLSGYARLMPFFHLPSFHPRVDCVAGYSGTPLARKLGIKPGTVLRAVNAPLDYLALLAPLPDRRDVAQKDTNELDVVHLFTRDEVGARPG